MKIKTLLATSFIAIFLLAACSTQKTKIIAHPLYSSEAFDIKNFTTDNDYGFTEKKAVKVGGALKMEGPRNERRFLNALEGPNGEKIFYSRTGSCCAFKTPNGIDGKTGLLDAYAVFYIKSLGDTVKNTIYINMYDTDSLYVPVGFTKKYKD